jgi:hypothetical protein
MNKYKKPKIYQTKATTQFLGINRRFIDSLESLLGGGKKQLAVCGLTITCGYTFCATTCGSG